MCSSGTFLNKAMLKLIVDFATILIGKETIYYLERRLSDSWGISETDEILQEQSDEAARSSPPGKQVPEAEINGCTYREVLGMPIKR
ncbi:hypothetical protein CWS01_19075 [Niallia nealsonii]|uniref:Uncharacterized protein n=1 Tax=Niallia nealsonii TaxID=115979 RepID=A0A2N0YXT3_9BACI|nr:hypothetical protein CWS01_19075 [Niallia nealsonii]